MSDNHYVQFNIWLLPYTSKWNVVISQTLFPMSYKLYYQDKLEINKHFCSSLCTLVSCCKI